MKLKFINFILASALMIGSAQVFTSCKDNEADSVHELNKKDKALQKLIEENQSKIADLRSDLIAETNNRVSDVATLNGRIDDTNNRLTQLSLALGNCATKEEFNIVKGQMDQLIAAAGGDINKLVESIKTIEKNRLAIEQIDNILNAEGTGLVARVTKLESAISVAQAAIGNLEDSISHHSELLTEVGNKAAEALAKAIANEAAIDGLTEAMKELATKEELNFYVDSLGNELNKIAQTYATTQWVDDNYAKKGDLTKYATKDDLLSYASKAELAAALEGVTDDITAACAQAVSDANDYTDQAIQDLIDHIEDYLPNTPGPSGSDWTEDQLKTLIKDVLNAEGGVNDRLSALEKEIEQLDEVNTKVKDLTDRVKELAERLSSIVVHQAVSTAIGTFNLPFGITNKLLLAYSGEAAQFDIDFPTSSRTMDGEGLVPDDILNGVKTYEIAQNEWLMTGAKENDGKGLLGLVYLTLNPNNVDYKNFDFSLKSSNTNYKGDAKVTLTPSNSELMLGYGRGESNGFYAAEVTVEEKYIPQYRFTLSSGFKSKVQSIISEPRSLASASTIAALSAALYSEVNGKLPALALSASWKEKTTGEELKVNSEYNLGATVVTPLSFQLFQTLEDQGKFDKIANKLRIPDLSKITEKFDAKFDEMTGKINIDLTPEKPFKAEYKNITIKVDKITVNINPVTAEPIEVVTEWAFINGQAVPLHKEVIDVAGDINPALDNLRASLEELNETLDGLNQDLGDLDKQLEDMVTSINDQVNGLFDDMNEKVNDQISDILADIKGQLNGMISGAIGRFDPVIDRMESIVNRLKSVLKYPSFYVQPCLVYKNSGNVGLISTNENMPSVFTVSGSNPAVTLVPTTYTLEAAVPCYLKYVAVVEAINNSTKQNDEAAVKDANSVEYMNKVLPSNVYTMPMVPLKLKKGYTYKIVYQAMDYSGYISGRDYYVTCK